MQSVSIDYFPDADPTAVHLALLRLLQTDERHLGPLLEQISDELQFHLAINSTVRNTIRQLASASPEGVQALRKHLAADSQFANQASNGLQKLVQSGDR